MALDQEAPPHDMVPRRGSRKGKERAIVGAQRSEDGQQGHGYTYQEPEYLTVDPAHHTRVRSAQGSVSPSGMDQYYPSYQGPPSRGTYDTRDTHDPELGHMDRGGGGVGNKYGLSVTELGGATPAVGGAYPPVSEEEAEERRIQEHLAKIAARDMARRKAARTSKLYAPAAAVPAGHSGDGGMGATAATALAPVTSTLVSGLSRASTLLRNRTRRGHSSRGSNAGGGGGSDADHLASSSPHSKRPASMFGFWRIPSIDSSMAEEREEERRHGGWVGEEGNEHVGLQYKPPRSPTSFSPLPTISRPTSANPYEQPTAGSGATSHAHTGYRVPSSSSASSLTDTLNPASAASAGGGRISPASRTTQPHIESDPVPLIRSDPRPLPISEAASWPNANDQTAADHHWRSATASDNQQQQPLHHSRMTSAGGSSSGMAGWKGAHWRGGAGGAGAAGYSAANYGASGEADGTELPVKRDRWWHALCAWGNELDDGAEDGQAGRTNPFE